MEDPYINQEIHIRMRFLPVPHSIFSSVTVSCPHVGNLRVCWLKLWVWYMCYCSGCDLYIYILHCFPHAQISFRSIPKNRDIYGSLLYEVILRQYCACNIAFNCLQQILPTTVTRGLCLCTYLEYVPLSLHGEMLYRHLVVVNLVPSSSPACFPFPFVSLCLVCLVYCDPWFQLQLVTWLITSVNRLSSCISWTNSVFFVSLTILR